MELDDLKNTWHNASGNLQQDETVNFIDQVTQNNYRRGIKKIAYPELIGSSICIAAIVFVGVNFHKLDTVFLQGTGILSIALLVLLTTLSYISIQQLNTKNVNRPYAEVVKVFAVNKLRFYKLQKINMTISYLLLVTTVILMSKFFAGKNITNSRSFWIYSICIGYIFLLFFSSFVSRFYKNTIDKTEQLLKEL